jgi:Mg2+/Co2+ transporter CorB
VTHFTGIVKIDQHMMHSIQQRVVIYVKDVEKITGLKNRSARRLLQKVKQEVGKTNFELVTVQDFCKVTAIPEETVRPFLLD